MKKLLFTIVFLSVISFFGISKVSALPIGSVLDNWETNKKFIGQFYADNGALLPFYSYSGYESAGWRCPYLDVGNFNFGPRFCYDTPSSEFYASSSFLVNSYPLCSQGDCTSTTGSVRNIVIILKESDYFQPGQTYHIELDMGVRLEWMDTLRAILLNASGWQNNGNVSNYDVVCYKEDAPLANNPYGRNFCRVSYDYVPVSTYPNVDFNILSNSSLAEFNYNIEWLIYPKISVDAMANFVKYEMRPDQKAFISGGSKTIDNNMYGRIYMPSKYGHYAYDYLAYFDFDRPTVLYENLIKDSEVTLDREYIYYDYDFTYGYPNEVLMLSADEWSIFDEKYPYDTIEFYVSSDTYVDIITPRYSPSNGLIMDFNYKDPITGQIVNHEHLGVSVPNDSTFFDNFGSILGFFKDSILNVGVMFSTFYSYIISDLGMFFLFIFSFGILSAIIIMFR